MVPVVVARHPVPLRRDRGPGGRASPGHMRAERQEVPEKSRQDGAAHPDVFRSEGPWRRLGLEPFRFLDNMQGALPNVALQVRAGVDEGDGFRLDRRVRGGDRTSAKAFQELRQTESDATPLKAHPVQGQGPGTWKDRSLDESFSIPPARQVFPVRGRSPEACPEGLGQGPDRRLSRGEDHIDVDRGAAGPGRHVVRNRIDERGETGDRLDGEEALRVIAVRVGGIQQMAPCVEGPGLPENSVQRSAGEARGNEADRIRGHLHGLDSHYADGDSQPSPLASACGVVSAQLSTYEGSRWANPCVVIRMLSKYVSSITASRPCTFPRAARERSAALPCGLCGVEPGWNVKDPSSTTPSRAP